MFSVTVHRQSTCYLTSLREAPPTHADSNIESDQASFKTGVAEAHLIRLTRATRERVLSHCAAPSSGTYQLVRSLGSEELPIVWKGTSSKTMCGWASGIDHQSDPFRSTHFQLRQAIVAKGSRALRTRKSLPRPPYSARRPGAPTFS